MRPEQCGTKIHIDVWHERALPPGREPLRLRTVLRCSLLPIVVWGVVGGLLFLLSPIAPAVEAVFFALLLAVVSGFRRRAGHTVRCCVYGALGGVLDKSLVGF
ncbi:hypothetical protein ACWERV_18485 [Streptomyces sp. NPDC004031]